MKRKKIFYLVSVLIFSSFFLVACNDKVKLDPKNPTTIHLATYYNGKQLEELKKMTKEYNETDGFEKGIIVDIKSTSSIPKVNKYIIDSANEVSGSDEFPDIFITYKTILPYLENKKEVIDFNDYFSKEELSEYVDNFLQIGTIQENEKSKLVMLPIGLSTDITFVNKTDFEKIPKSLGITYDDFNNYEDLILAGEKYYNYTDSLTPQKNDGKTLYGSDSLVEHVFSSMQSMERPMFVQENGSYKVVLSKKDAKKLWDIFCVPIIKGYFSKYAKFTSEDMKTGNLLASTSSTAGSVYYPSKITTSDGSSRDIEIDILKSPGMKGHKTVALQQGGGIFVSKSTPVKEFAATEFVKWLTNKENNTRFALNTSYAPVRKDNISAEFINDFAKNNNIRDISAKSAIITLNQIEQEELYVPPMFDNYENVRSVVRDVFDKEIRLKRLELLERSENGEDYDSLILEYTSDDSFEKWYEDIMKRIENSFKNFN